MTQKAEISLGAKYANRWIYYWAANQANSYIIKPAPDAYGANYTNTGITKSDDAGRIIFKLECRYYKSRTILENRNH
jgi:hypothetical protein